MQTNIPVSRKPLGFQWTWATIKGLLLSFCYAMRINVRIKTQDTKNTITEAQ